MADRANGILLDSSVVIAYFRGRLDFFSLLDPGEEAYLRLVVLAELYKGAEKSTRIEDNLRQVDDFLQRASLLHPDISTARIYAGIAATLEAEGQPGPRMTSGSLLPRWSSTCRWRREMPISIA